MNLQIPGHVVMLFLSKWSLRNKLNAFHLSTFNILSCGRASLINFRVAWKLPLLHRSQLVLVVAAPRLVHADCAASLLAILLNTLPTAIG